MRLGFFFAILLFCRSLSGGDIILPAKALEAGPKFGKRIAISGEKGEGWLWRKEMNGARLTGNIANLPAECGGVKIAVTIALPAGAAAREPAESVWRVRMTQDKNSEFEGVPVNGVPVRVGMPPSGGAAKSAVLESYYPVDPALPLKIQLERLTSDPADTFPGAIALLGITVSPLAAPAAPKIVADSPGYNGWPMLQPLGDKLVCVYSRGKGHYVTDPDGNSYSRLSGDGGITWGPENATFDYATENVGVIGIGVDEKGSLLCWTRAWGEKREKRFELHRSPEGKKFEKIAEPELAPLPMQIMSPVRIPGKGLLSLWFSGSYKKDDGSQCWGTLLSRDNGLTWEQRTIESGLLRKDWPTEPAIVFLGDGRILGIGRVEGNGTTSEHALFQLQSADGGETWTKARTNITDVCASTPSLIYDRKSGCLCCYYFYRGRGLLNRRVVPLKAIWDHPGSWPAPDTVALGKTEISDSGNVYAAAMKGKHILAYYMGDHSNAAVVAAVVPAPDAEDGR